MVRVSAKAENFLSRYSFVVLFCLLVLFCVLTPLVQHFRTELHDTVPSIAEGVTLLALLLAAVNSASTNRRAAAAAAMLGIAGLVSWFVAVVSKAVAASVLSYLFLIVFFILVICVILKAIFASEYVTFNTVCASLCIYLLFALLWAIAYSLIDVLDPSAFTYTVAGSRHAPTLRIGTGDAGILYFSVVTLTTLGYGDIVPTSAISRMMASVEAVTGQLYLAVLVARLVGMHIVHGMNASGRESENREPNTG